MWKLRSKGEMAVPRGRLEQESRRMEERLSMLREMMRAEKARRGVSGGVHWRSGKIGPLQRKAGRLEAEKGRASHRELQDPWRILQEGAPVRIKVLTENNDSSTGPRSHSCGQCDKFSATVVCVECGEKYCSVCFAKFHQKGALSQHHVRPLVKSSAARKTKPRPEPTTAQSAARSESGVQVCTSGTEPAGGLLLQGTYDEASSAAGFQEALAAWRAGGQPHTTDSSVTTTAVQSTGCSTQTTAAQQATGTSTPPDIHFTGSGVSYFERLIIRRHRVEPGISRHHVEPSSHIRDQPGAQATRDDRPSEGSPSPQAGISQYNLFYTAETCSDPPASPPPAAGCHQVASTAPHATPYIEEVGVQPLVGAESPRPLQTQTQADYTGKSSQDDSLDISSPVPTTLPESCLDTSALPHTPDSHLAASIKQAWEESHQQAHCRDRLGQFFLVGLESSDEAVAESSEAQDRGGREALEVSSYSSCVWVPASSVEHCHSDTDPTPTAVQTHTIDIASDLPPSGMADSPSPPTASEDSTSDSELVLLDEEEEEEEERDECDSRALETLARELASITPTVIVREEEEEGYHWGATVDMERVISEFELYQQQLMGEDSGPCDHPLL